MPSSFEGNKYRVERIEGDRKTREETYEQRIQETTLRPVALAVLCLLLKQALGPLILLPSPLLLQVTTENLELAEDLSRFQQLLFLLGKEDQSHDPTFTKNLTEVWHKIEYRVNQIKSLHKAKDSLINNINGLLEEVRAYPPGSSFSIGYYLEEYAGKEWQPFPFFVLLQELHRQYQVDAEHSTLLRWITKIKECLEGVV